MYAVEIVLAFARQKCAIRSAAVGCSNVPDPSKSISVQKFLKNLEKKRELDEITGKRAIIASIFIHQMFARARILPNDLKGHACISISLV